MIWLALAGCPKHVVESALPTGTPDPVGGPWETTLQAENPLVGHLWNVRAGRFASEDELLADLRSVPYVLLGEKHDNPDHHRLQARIITALHPKGCVFEMLDHLDAIGEATDPDALATAADWAHSGWPDFAMYRPVFAACYDAGAAIVPGSPTHDEVKAAMTTGIDALPATLIDGLDRSHPLDDAQRESLGAEINQAHCGQGGPELVQAMITAQVLKDSMFARALSEQESPSVLVAGGGHTRPDRGVPLYLEPDSRTVLMTEVNADQPDPAKYADGDADWLWFTPEVSDADPCKAFKKQLSGMGSPH